ncbi:hypothetical protein [Yoonia sp.]|uniref:hypothetical protein n=1 Tax=Yoonia sp. TaxID=2212373 RepID=UPI0025DE4120|nr:hypothetical protein [Yoonia sp.]
MPKTTPLSIAQAGDRLADAQTALQRALKTAPQDLWLDTIRRTTPGRHDELIFWMLNRTECDFAVAVHAFYQTNPAHHLDNPVPLPMHPTASDIFSLVLLNWDKGYFRTHTLSVESQDAEPRSIACMNQKVMARPRGSLPFTIPAKFLKPQGGTPVDLPPHLSPDNAAHLWPLYAALGLRVPAVPPGLSRRMARAKGVFDKIGFGSQRS